MGQIFRAGNAAFCWAGTWETGANASTQGLNFSAQPTPRFFGTNDACWADAHAFTIPTKQSRNNDDTQAAVNFAYWASSKGVVTWAQSGQIPAYTPALTSAEFTALPYRSGYAKAAATAVMPAQHENFGRMKDSMIRNLDTIWTDQAATAAAIDTIYNDIASAARN
jgi:multiple sugar transport system substrate-binding protein